MKNIFISFSSDDNYAPFLCVAIYSLLKHSSKKNKYIIYVLDGGISKKNKIKILNTVFKFKNKKIVFLKVNKKILKVKKVLHFNQSAYYRLLLPDILPNVSRIIYFDCDLIFLKDIGSLYKIDLESKIVACCEEFHPNYKTALRWLNSDVQFSKIVNSGVMLMDLSKLRKGNYSQIFVDFANKNSKKLLAADQDIINIFLTNKIKVISPKWNSTSRLFVFDSHKRCSLSKRCFDICIKDPSVVHFSGIKPWSSGSSHPYKKVFFKYLGETEFRDFKVKFDLKRFIRNRFFFIGSRFVNLLPQKLYVLVEKKNLLRDIF